MSQSSGGHSPKKEQSQQPGRGRVTPRRTSGGGGGGGKKINNNMNYYVWGITAISTYKGIIKALGTTLIQTSVQRHPRTSNILRYTGIYWEIFRTISNHPETVLVINRGLSLSAIFVYIRSWRR